MGGGLKVCIEKNSCELRRSTPLSLKISLFPSISLIFTIQRGVYNFPEISPKKPKNFRKNIFKNLKICRSVSHAG